MEENGQFHAPITSSLQKEPSVPMEQEAGWVLEPLWLLWRRDYVMPLLGPAHCLVTILTELFWLQNKLTCFLNV
jgi:hypothetical protein